MSSSNHLLANYSMLPHPIYAIPIFDEVLIYAPLQELSILVNRAAAKHLCAAIRDEEKFPSDLASIIELTTGICSPISKEYETNSSKFSPIFLGIIPTLDCNLACRYCDFAIPTKRLPRIPLDYVKLALDFYANIVVGNSTSTINVHFFGGEPFVAPDIVQFAVAYTSQLATQHSLQKCFEVTTNGVYPKALAHWIADHFNTVVLSLDGTEDIQEFQRPSKSGRPYFPLLYQNAKIFSEGNCELILRICVTDRNIRQLASIVDWIGNEFRPSSVCMEPMHSFFQTHERGLKGTSPYEFARQFHFAAEVLERNGIGAFFSTSDISACRASICPVGQDALIVFPNGNINACYLPEYIWRSSGLDFHIGRIYQKGVELDSNALKRTRELIREISSQCADCFCYYHCAGGCHVRRMMNESLCIQTRLITIANLLRQLGEGELATRFLQDRLAIEAVLHQNTDLMEKQVW